MFQFLKFLTTVPQNIWELSGKQKCQTMRFVAALLETV